MAAMYAFAFGVRQAQLTFTFDNLGWDRFERLQAFYFNRVNASIKKLQVQVREKQSRKRVLARTRLIKSELQETVLHPDRLVYLRAEFSSATQHALMLQKNE